MEVGQVTEAISNKRRSTPMPKSIVTEDFIIELFCRIDDEMKDFKKHSQSRLYASKIVTIRLFRQ
ncbi:MAG: hypothetical protein NZ805_16065 [Armatimonadetes bacterium]|nr:hypothetical protein [Armatimonadota bacterium]